MKRFIGCLMLALGATATATPTPNLTDKDRVVFVGGALVERDQQFGYFETYLDVAFAKSNFTFRNLGWSGDDVWGTARAEFGTQADGYKKLIDEVTSAKPTVLLINYGMNESFAGKAGLPEFVAQYKKLLDDLSKTGAKVWLIGPNRHEKLPPPLPDPVEHDQNLRLYTDAIAQIAAERGCGFVDLMKAVRDDLPSEDRLTEDGIHYNAAGARAFAAAMAMRFNLTLAVFPKNFDAIRRKTIEKNREFFYRWRPQNDTYIFGFRKYEQGKNAVEIPQFDPIVKRLESEIAEMKKQTAKK